MGAQILQLPESDQEFTGYFAGTLVATFQETSRENLIAGVRELDPDGEFASNASLGGMNLEAVRNVLLQLRFVHYIERLSAEGLPKMATATWLDFATTVIECLPERERGMVWDYLDRNEDVMRSLKAFLEPMLSKLKYGYEKMQNGGLPPLKSVPA